MSSVFNDSEGLYRTTVCRWLVHRPHYSARLMRFGSRGPSGYGNVYRSVREKQGIVVYRQRVLQTVTSLGVVSLVFRRHDLLKIANFNPQQEARFSLWKKLVPRMRLVAEMESRCKGIIMNISYLKLN